MKIINYLFYISFFLMIIIIILSFSLSSNKDDIVIYKEPYQKMLDEPITFKIDKFEITKVAEYEITARVLSKKRYNDRVSSLSKYDFALGWNKMSDLNVLEDVVINQRSRWYYWNLLRNDKISESEVINSTANTHLYSNDREINRTIRKVKQNDIVIIKGYLINFVYDEKYIYKTSLTRDDVGNNSCEIIWVEEIEILK